MRVGRYNKVANLSFYEVLHQQTRIPFAVESSLPPVVLEKELVDYPLRFVNESVNEMKKKGKLKEFLPKRRNVYQIDAILNAL